MRPLLVLAVAVALLPFNLTATTECFDFPDTTSFCVYSEWSFCLHQSGVLIADDARDGEIINASNAMSDDWLHLTRPDSTGSGLPHRSLLGGEFRSRRLLQEAGARRVPGTSAVASFDFGRADNIYHFASSVLVGFLARVHYLEKNSSAAERHRHLVAENAGGFDRALLLADEAQLTDWARAVAALAFSPRAELLFMKDLAPLAAGAPVCFERAVVLGKSINLFSGTWDATRFRALVAAQHGVIFRKEVITVCLRRSPRSLLNHEELVSAVSRMGLGLEVVVARFEEMGFGAQLALMARTAVLVSVHGAGMTNCIFLPPGAAVLEISPFRFNYNLYERIAVNSGLLYFRYVASFEEMDYVHSRVPDFAQFAKQLTNRQCNSIEPQCLVFARDVDIRVNIERFASYFEAATDVIE